jgi:hypothetical protein
MATKLEEFDFEATKRGAKSKYPWDDWSDGSIWQIESFEDYDCETASMVASIRAQASKRGLRAQVLITYAADNVDAGATQDRITFRMLPK